MCVATGVSVYMAVSTQGDIDELRDVVKIHISEKKSPNLSLQRVPPSNDESTIHVDDLKPSWGRKQLRKDHFKSSSERF